MISSVQGAVEDRERAFRRLGPPGIEAKDEYGTFPEYGSHQRDKCRPDAELKCRWHPRREDSTFRRAQEPHCEIRSRDWIGRGSLPGESRTQKKTEGESPTPLPFGP